MLGVFLSCSRSQSIGASDERNSMRFIVGRSRRWNESALCCDHNCVFPSELHVMSLPLLVATEECGWPLKKIIHCTTSFYSPLHLPQGGIADPEQNYLWTLLGSKASIDVGVVAAWYSFSFLSGQKWVVGTIFAITGF